MDGTSWRGFPSQQAWLPLEMQHQTCQEEIADEMECLLASWVEADAGQGRWCRLYGMTLQQQP